MWNKSFKERCLKEFDIANDDMGEDVIGPFFGMVIFTVTAEIVLLLISSLFGEWETTVMIGVAMVTCGLLLVAPVLLLLQAPLNAWVKFATRDTIDLFDYTVGRLGRKIAEEGELNEWSDMAGNVAVLRAFQISLFMYLGTISLGIFFILFLINYPIPILLIAVVIGGTYLSRMLFGVRLKIKEHIDDPDAHTKEK